MVQLTPEAKEAIIKQALSRGDKKLRHVADDNNIGYSTLQRWLQLKRNGKPVHSSRWSYRSNTTDIRQLEHVLATANLDDQAIGTYCREQGIYSFQLKQWKDELMASNKQARQTKDINEIKALREENKLLKRDLQRKEKALAETTALLVLKKKADLIWGDPAED